MDCILCGTKFETSAGPCPQCGWNADDVYDASAGLRPGELVRSRYEVDEPLGVGRLGAVIKAVDVDSGAEVVVKFIHRALIPDERTGRAFLKGIRPLIKSAHPYMNRVLDVNCEGEKYFVVFAYIDGIPLRRLMNSRRSQGQCFTLDEFFPIIKQVAQFFAESGVDTHGSISPENLWIQPQHIKLLDVGLAANLPVAAVAHRLRSSDLVRGYVAPEVIRGQMPDPRSDVFALGVLLGEMLTQVRYDGRSEMFQEVDPDLPPDIDVILRRALLTDPRGRHADACELLEAIAEVAGFPVPSFARSERPTKPPPREPIDLGVVDEPSRPAAPISAADFGLQDAPDSTVQVSMADVIRAHAEGAGPGLEDSPVPLVRPSSPPPPPHRSSTTPPPPERHSSTPPPPMRATAPRPGPRQATPPPARRPSVPPPASAGAPQPPPMVRVPPLAAPSQPIEPRRPSPLRRDTVPPPPLKRLAPPPVAVRADAQLPTADEDEDTAVRRYGSQRREVTQEIELDQVETIEDARPRHEITQEVELDMIESITQSSMKDAVDKLEAQATAAEVSSDEELLRHADRLDGVDPRFVRAAHVLEADRRGARSRRAAEILKERASHLDGIDPRLLRAAARLEEAKIHDTSSVVKIEEIREPEEEPEPEKSDDDDWRERMSKTAEDSVISFLAPPVVERSPEVRGFPRVVQRRPQPRPPTEPPRAPAPPPRSGNRREPQRQRPRALYDDSGETDDESQPTIRVTQSSLAGNGGVSLSAGALRGLELVLLLTAGLLLLGMATLVALAIAQS